MLWKKWENANVNGYKFYININVYSHLYNVYSHLTFSVLLQGGFRSSLFGHLDIPPLFGSLTLLKYSGRNLMNGLPIH